MADPAPSVLLDAEVVEELVAEWSTSVGRKIRKRRKELGFTLETMAGLTGLSRQTVHRAERDAATLRDEARHLVAIALGAEVADLWEPIPAEQLRRRAKALA